MGSGYGYSLDREAVEVLLQCSVGERRRLLAVFEQLARYPFLAGDHRWIGADGRTNEVLDAEAFVVTYWSDHAVRNVRILAIERT